MSTHLWCLPHIPAGDYVFSRGAAQSWEYSRHSAGVLPNLWWAAGEPRAGLENGGFFWPFFALHLL